MGENVGTTSSSAGKTGCPKCAHCKAKAKMIGISVTPTIPELDIESEPGGGAFNMTGCADCVLILGGFCKSGDVIETPVFLHHRQTG